MSLAAFDESHDFSARRLLVGYACGATVLIGLVVLGAVFGQEIKKKVAEEATPVVFTPKAPEPARPAVAKVEPPKPAPAKAKSLAPPPLGRPESLAPKEVPTTAPKEGNPDAPVAELPGVPGGSPDGVVGGTGTGGGVASAPKPTVTATAAPPPAPMAFVTEAILPPRALRQEMPTFPEEARKAGVQAVVTVKYVVTEDGTVTDVTVVRGHPMLDAEVVRAVRAWRFAPATLDGRPVRVTRYAKLPFRPRA